MSDQETNIGHDRLARLMKRGTDFLGCEVAVLGGAMSWISERNLVSALSNAGAFGVIACGAMTPDLLDTEIAETRKRTDRPFGVNLITMHPHAQRADRGLRRHDVSHVVFAGGLPPAGAIDKVKAFGAKLICFAPALALAKKLVRSGVDALVIEGMEAGGHIGPVSTSVLAQEILPPLAAEVPIFVAGGIGHGGLIAGYLEMGAVGVQLGTRFVCATECIAHPNFKKAFIRASARDAITAVQIDPRLPVIPVRALKNREMESFAAKQREVAQMLDEGQVEMVRGPAPDRALLGRRAPPRGDRGRRRDRLGHGRPVGRDGQGRGAGRRHPQATGRRGRPRAGAALGSRLRPS